MQFADFTELSGTELCYPPEYFKTKCYNGEELDFWGAALVLYSIVECICEPFETANDVMHKKLLLCNNKTSKHYKDFIQGALCKHRERRFNFETVWHQTWMR